MAFVLIALIIAFFTKSSTWIVASIVLLVINMTYYKFYKYIALLWYGLSNLLGMVSSKVLLTLIFVFVITPIGFLRKIMGLFSSKTDTPKFDSMKIKQFKLGKKSVFINKNKLYTKKDLSNPY